MAEAFQCDRCCSFQQATSTYRFGPNLRVKGDLCLACQKAFNAWWKSAVDTPEEPK